MEKDFKKGIEGIRNIKLSKGDKETVLLHILENIKSKEAVEAHRQKHSPFQMLGFTISYRLAYTVASILIIVIAGGSTTFAAEGAVPGNILYPVKVSINEPLFGFLKSDGEEKVLWEAEKASRRLEEAEILIAHGAFDSEKISELETRFEENSNEFRKTLDSIETESELVILSLEADFNAKIVAHSKILERLEAYADDEQKENVQSIKEKVAEKFATRFASNDANVSMFAMALPAPALEARSISMKAVPADEDVAVLESAFLTQEDVPILLQASNSAEDKELLKRKEDIQKLIEKTEERLEKSKERGDVSEIRDGILNDSRDALDEAKRLLDENGSFEILIESERALKQADISLKQGNKLKFNKENKEYKEKESRNKEEDR